MSTIGKSAQLIVVILFGLVGAVSAAEKVGRCFKEDHLTGAEYLVLEPDGTYRSIAREHIGVMPVDSGKWEFVGNRIVFTSTGGKLKYGAELATYRRLTFLVWKSDPPLGIVIPIERIKVELDGKPKSLPPYIFFAAEMKQCKEELSSTYPFKYIKPTR